ncbi:MAG: hypothetical protein KatS3mg119_0029 [Rhodothalassiaceae bacterium]|nr:MAG: hypothetical protein KatS3mg119_0029 [Rhodothalassiaceae bacterium]
MPDVERLEAAIARGDPDLYSDIAEEWAKAVAEEGKREGRKNQSTQLRRFYNEISIWNERANDRRRDFADILPFVLMVRAKVAYAKGRKNVTDIYEKMINAGLQAIRAGKDTEEQRKRLMRFKIFLEAFTGFHGAMEKGGS